MSGLLTVSGLSYNEDPRYFDDAISVPGDGEMIPTHEDNDEHPIGVAEDVQDARCAAYDGVHRLPYAASSTRRPNAPPPP